MVSKRKSVGVSKRASRPSDRGGVEVPAVLEPVVAAVSSKPGVSVERGWGSSSVALKVRGKIFAMLIQETLVLKLPKERVDELVASSAGERFDPRRDGRVMKEWVVLDWKDRRRVALAAEAYGFVSRTA